MPNHKRDINNRGSFSTDMIGVNYNWPEASYEQRKKIFYEHVAYTKGLLFFCKPAGVFQTEIHDLANPYPEIVKRLSERWNEWAKTHQVFPKPNK